MPTRVLGDLRLKHPEFNFHNHPAELGYRYPMPKFNGPYLNHEPEIMVLDITKDDQYLVLASDGLWDEISRKKSAEIVKGKDGDLKSVAGCLFDAALDHVSKERGISREFIAQAAPGMKKRSIHDDITILVLALQGQVE